MVQPVPVPVNQGALVVRLVLVAVEVAVEVVVAPLVQAALVVVLGVV